MGEGGGIGGKCPLFVPWGKVPFFGIESALFSLNKSAVLAKLGQCPLTFEVLPRPALIVY